jgi:hypothetical protein
MFHRASTVSADAMIQFTQPVWDGGIATHLFSVTALAITLSTVVTINIKVTCSMCLCSSYRCIFTLHPTDLKREAEILLTISIRSICSLIERTALLTTVGYEFEGFRLGESRRYRREWGVSAQRYFEMRMYMHASPPLLRHISDSRQDDSNSCL